MLSQIASVPGTASALLLLFAWSRVASALEPEYCASFNNAGAAPVSDTFENSNGVCVDACKAQYAYAITQGNKCWCSNYTPAQDDIVDSSRCNTGCPYYPPEPCGGDGVYGYLPLDKQPSGTKGAGSSPSTSKSEPEPSTTKSTKPAPTTSMVQTVTVNGEIKTVTVVPTSTDPPGSTAGDNAGTSAVPSASGGGGGLSTGAIVGIVIGVVALVLIAVGVFLFWFLRKRKQDHESDYQDDPSVRGSSSGMMGSNRPEMSHSGGSPASPGSAGNRNSLLQIDPRMDPLKQTMYGRNGSTESVNTLRDDHDYSRRIQQPPVLRATNPDPE